MDDGVENGAGEPPRRDALEGAGHGLAMVMDELAHGVLVASAKGLLLHANHAARTSWPAARSCRCTKATCRPPMRASRAS